MANKSDSFDPEAYLAEKASATNGGSDGFDPASYLAEKQGGAATGTMAQSSADEPWKPFFNSKAEYDAAVAKQATDNPESLSAKAGYAGRAVASSAVRIGLPVAAVALAPATGGASLALGAAGGAAGEYLGGKIEGADSTLGQIAGAGVMGAIPGANLAKAGIGEVIGAGIKQGAGNLASTALETGIDKQRLPTAGEAATSFLGGAVAAPASKFLGGVGNQLTEQQANNAMRDEVHRAWRAAGGKIDPAAVGNGIPGVQTLAGKEGMKQVVSVENAPVVTKLIREELGISGNGPISVKTLDDVRKEAGRSYAGVAQISTQAASDLESLKQARFNAQELGAAYKSTGNPAARQPWIDAKNTAQNLENLIEQHAQNAGKPDLVKQLRKDRVRIAQSYDVETALNPSNGQIDAGTLAAGYNGRNLTGNLKLVADVANTFPQYVIEPSRIGAPAVSRLGTYSAAQAAAHASPAGFMAAGVPALGGPARKFLLSDVVQNWAAKNPTDKIPENVRQAFIRFGLLSSGRQYGTFMPKPIAATPDGQ